MITITGGVPERESETWLRPRGKLRVLFDAEGRELATANNARALVDWALRCGARMVHYDYNLAEDE